MTELSPPLSPAHAPLAIVGIGCRLAANISTVDALWDFLQRGGDAIRPVPADRWSTDRFYDANPDRAGKTFLRQAGFLEALPIAFDAEAFGLSPREAAHLDPQQRLLLETTWEALENAGQPIDDLRGSATGVFMGGFTLDMMIMLLSPHNRELISNHTATAATMAMLANRVSHVFDLHGPSITCDTACSSSLTAFHLACQSIWRGECDRVLVGGVNVMLRPEFPMAMSKGRFLAPDGRCKTFSARADGYGRGEGAAVVVLKPLAQAERDGDRIYATVIGTGINQDGGTPGITLPRRESQEALMRQVIKQADIDPAQIAYIEAHGTGTQAGDTTEAEAIANVLGKSRPTENPLIVGSIKTNFGHLEAASGVLGIIKAALCLHHRTVPRHLHFDEPNPAIPFADWGLQVPTQSLPLLSTGSAPCLAAVNSFGYGGSNAHAVLAAAEPAPVRRAAETVSTQPPWRLFPFSARSLEALTATAASLHAWLDESPPPPDLADLAHTLALRRSHHDARSVVVARTLAELQQGLAAASRGEHPTGVASGRVAPDVMTGPVMVFTGMGPQWWAMGHELWQDEPVFRAALEAVEAHFAPLAGWSLLDAMQVPEAESRISETVVSQPANFALQYALAQLWASWGIKPAAIVGHSVGEIAAAAVAGALSLADAVTVVYHRSQLQRPLEGQGRMLATNLSPAEATELAAGLPDLVSVAAINSGASTVLSGDAVALDELAAGLIAAGHDARFLRVEVAYHSHQMQPLQDALIEALPHLDPHAPSLPLFSTVTGAPVETAIHDAAYWWQNLRQPVRFHDAIEAVLDAGHRTFLEVGPHPVLGGSLREILQARQVDGSCHFSLKRQTTEALTLRTALAELHVRGIAVDWSAVNPGDGARLVDLPAYPWQREHLWVESETSRLDRLGSPGPRLLGDRAFSDHYQREIRLSPQRLPWMQDHQVEGATVFPAAGYVDAMISSARELLPDQRSFTLEDVAFHHLLVLADEQDSLLQLDYDATSGEFRLAGARSTQTEAWQLHATARLVQGEVAAARPRRDIAQTLEAFPTVIACETIYAVLAARQLDYGPAFRRLREIHRRPGAVVARLSIQPNDTLHAIHPGLLDGAFQAMLGALDPTRVPAASAFVPVGVKRITLFAPPQTDCWAHIEITQADATTLHGNVQLHDEAGHLLLDLEDIHCRSLASSHHDADVADTFAESWEPIETRPGDSTDGTVLIIGHPDATTTLAEICIKRGISTVVAASWPMTETPAMIIDANALTAPADNDPTRAAQSCHALGQRLHQIGQLPSPPRVIVLTRRAIATTDAPVLDPLAAGLWGVTRVARLEYPALELGLIDVDTNETSLTVAMAVACDAGQTSEPEVAVRAGQVYGRRLRSLSPPAEAPTKVAGPESCCRLEQAESGLISSLRLREQARRGPAPGELEIRVDRAALNFKDVLKVLDTIDPRALSGTFFEANLGMEYVGTVTAVGRDVAPFQLGERVFGCARSGCMQTHLLLDPTKDLVFPETTPTPVPQFVAAATVWLGLCEIARLRRGERVLIHSATGAVGLYAISYAQSVGAEIFATAGNEEKRDYLRSLGIEHVYDSRHLGFAEAIRTATAGYGVDVVLNALSGEFLRQSLALLAPYGRFVEIGKQDIMANSGLPLAGFNRNLSFTAIDVDRLLVDRPEEFFRILNEANLARAQGILRDPPVEVFPARDAAAAFQRLAQAKHIGKIAIEFDLTGAHIHPASDRPTIRRDASYLITGGLAGFGAETARWLAAQGAGHLVLVGRRGEHTPGAVDLRAELEANGAKVEVATLDVADRAAVRGLVQRLAAATRPLRGIFHAAGVLVDRTLADLTAADYDAVFAPKVGGAFALHEATRDLPLDHFVLFSSITAVSGNIGQANYAAANAILDALASHRRAQGYAACSVNWGAIARVGMAARDPQVLRHLEAIGLGGLDPMDALATWSRHAPTGPAHLVIASINWETWLARHPGVAGTSLLRHLREAPNERKPRGSSLPPDFASLPSEARLAAVEGIVRQETALVLKTSPDRIESHRTLSQSGLDSLMEIELRIALGKALGVEMSRMDFARASTLDGVITAFNQRLRMNQPSPQSTPALESLSGADLDALLQSLEAEEAVHP